MVCDSKAAQNSTQTDGIAQRRRVLSFNLPAYRGQLSSITCCQHETKKILFKPIDGQNLRLTTGLARFHQQFIFSVSTDLSNPKPGPDIPRAGRVGAPGGAAVRGRAILGANRTIRPRIKSPPYPPRHRRNIAPTSFQKHEHAKSYVNRRRNKISV